MNISIVDDQPAELAALKENLNRFAGEQHEIFEITEFSSADAFLKDLQKNIKACQLVILDIDMPGTNGMDAAKKMRTVSADIAIMFITNMPQYALEGYSVDAVDYSLKPIQYPDFVLKMKKALRYIARSQDPKIAVQTPDEVVLVHASDIYYVESRLHYLTYHTKAGNFRSRDTLNHAEKTLSGINFSRCSASYLVNLRYLESMRGDDIVVNGELLRVSRGKRQTFREDFTRYMSGVRL